MRIFSVPTWYTVRKRFRFRTEDVTIIDWNAPDKTPETFRTTVFFKNGLSVDVFNEERAEFAEKCYNLTAKFSNNAVNGELIFE